MHLQVKKKLDKIYVEKSMTNKIIKKIPDKKK